VHITCAPINNVEGCAIQAAHLHPGLACHNFHNINLSLCDSVLSQLHTYVCMSSLMYEIITLVCYVYVCTLTLKTHSYNLTTNNHSYACKKKRILRFKRFRLLD
jgi:hypothetical protein